jgi:hypothetical protein
MWKRYLLDLPDILFFFHVFGIRKRAEYHPTTHQEFSDKDIVTPRHIQQHNSAAPLRRLACLTEKAGSDVLLCHPDRQASKRVPIFDRETGHKCVLQLLLQQQPTGFILSLTNTSLQESVSSESSESHKYELFHLSLTNTSLQERVSRLPDAEEVLEASTGMNVLKSYSTLQ